MTILSSDLLDFEMLTVCMHLKTSVTEGQIPEASFRAILTNDFDPFSIVPKPISKISFITSIKFYHCIIQKSLLLELNLLFTLSSI